MDSTVIALISGLGGAIIGSMGTVTTIYLQLRANDRRERMMRAAELATQERQLLVDNARANGQRLGLLPLSIFISTYLDVLKALDDGSLTREKMKEINDRTDDLSDFAMEIERERGERRQMPVAEA